MGSRARCVACLSYKILVLQNVDRQVHKGIPTRKDMSNISYLKGMLTLKEFGLYFAQCAKDDAPLPTINKIEMGVEVWGRFDSTSERYGFIYGKSWSWHDCGSVNTEIPDEDYTEIEIYKRPLKIVFTEVTKNFKEFVEGNEEYGWPHLYWG